MEKRQYQDLNKMVAFTNVLGTFKEAEPVPLKAAGLVALVLVTTGEANAGNVKILILLFMQFSDKNFEITISIVQNDAKLNL